jgi:hypothetical protein
MARRLLLAVLAASVLGVAGAPAATAPARLAVAPAGRSAFEFVARIDQQGTAFRFYGYLTSIRGLADTALFTDPANRGEATARLTFSGTTTLTGRSVLDGVFAVASSGDWDVFWNANAGARFADPASFAGGTRVARFALRFHNVLKVYGPNRGLTTGAGEAEQRSAAAFVADGRARRIGRPGAVFRLAVTGLGRRLEPTAPRAVLAVAGDAVAVGRSAR